jgi:hypothetical protein
MPQRKRLFTRSRRGPSFFGVVAAFALAGALVLAFSPAHAPSPGHSHLQAHAALIVPQPPVPAPPRLQREARSSLQVFECTGQTSCRFEECTEQPTCRFEVFAPPP